jgi:hypothetical protein
MSTTGLLLGRNYQVFNRRRRTVVYYYRHAQRAEPLVVFW